MRERVGLCAGEFEVEPTDELIYRQITEHLWDAQADRPSSIAFGPCNADRGMPSFSRSSKVTAQASRDWHQEHGKSRSHGVWACTTAEVQEAGTRVVDDANLQAPPGYGPKSPGHCYVDYRTFSKSMERTVRALLLTNALKRGEIDTIDILAADTL